MTEAYENKLILEKKEKRKKEFKKHFYKNWKIYAISLGAIAISTGTGLGIYYGVNANQTREQKITNQDFVNAINQASYKAETDRQTQPETIINQIDANFIVEQLSDKMKNAFNQELFHLNNIFIGDHELNGDDLKQVGIIIGKINYDYDAIKNQTTTLTITVKMTAINQEDIVAEINESSYQIIVYAGDELTAATKQIDANFIVKQLKKEYQEAFEPEQFSFKKITINDHELTDEDLKEVRDLETEINYDYDAIKNQTTTLTINVKRVITDAEIVNKINNQTYELLNVDSGTNAENIIESITAKFIKENLTEEIRDGFNDDKFSFIKITFQNHDLNDDDLITEEPVVLNTEIWYHYGSFANQLTALDIYLVV